MKKNFKYYIVVWAIALVLYIAVSLVMPGCNYAALIITALAFAAQLGCAYFAFKPAQLSKVFYNIPIIRISYIGVIITAVAGILFALLPVSPFIGTFICLAVLLFTVISVLKANAASELVSDVDEKVKAQTLFVKSLTADAESLLARAASPEAKSACKKVYEAIRYSDPMSSDALAGVESQITLKFNEFSAAVADGAENIGTLADELTVLIGDRNKKCKLLK